MKLELINENVKGLLNNKLNLEKYKIIYKNSIKFLDKDLLDELMLDNSRFNKDNTIKNMIISNTITTQAESVIIFEDCYFTSQAQLNRFSPLQTYFVNCFFEQSLFIKCEKPMYFINCIFNDVKINECKFNKNWFINSKINNTKLINTVIAGSYYINSNYYDFITEDNKSYENGIIYSNQTKKEYYDFKTYIVKNNIKLAEQNKILVSNKLFINEEFEFKNISNFEFIDCKFENCRFTQKESMITTVRSDVKFTKCNFENTIFEYNINIMYAHFESCIFNSSQLNSFIVKSNFIACIFDKTVISSNLLDNLFINCENCNINKEKNLLVNTSYDQDNLKNQIKELFDNKQELINSINEKDIYITKLQEQLDDKDKIILENKNITNQVNESSLDSNKLKNKFIADITDYINKYDFTIINCDSISNIDDILNNLNAEDKEKILLNMFDFKTEINDIFILINKLYTQTIKLNGSIDEDKIIEDVKTVDVEIHEEKIEYNDKQFELYSNENTDVEEIEQIEFEDDDSEF